MAQSIKNTIEVVVGDDADIRCPILDTRDPGEIVWLRDRHEVVHPRHTVSQSGRKFHLAKWVATERPITLAAPSWATRASTRAA